MPRVRVRRVTVAPRVGVRVEAIIRAGVRVRRVGCTSGAAPQLRHGSLLPGCYVSFRIMGKANGFLGYVRIKVTDVLGLGLRLGACMVTDGLGLCAHQGYRLLRVRVRVKAIYVQIQVMDACVTRLP